MRAEISDSRKSILPLSAIATFIIGAFFTTSTTFAGPEDPEEGGKWGAVVTWPHIAVSGANLPDGRVLTWSGSERETWPTTEQTYSAAWDPATGQFEEIFHAAHNMFCAHLAMLEDGRVFVNGGRNGTNSPWASVFDYRNDRWEQVEEMASGGRWYPTSIATANGDVFTAIGTASQPRYPEIWNVQDGWRIKNGIDFNEMVLDDYFSSGSHGESRWWPILHIAPNGQIFHSGPTPKMHYIDTAGNGSFSQVGPTFTDWYHKHGTSIMYAAGRILTAGGWTAGNNGASTNKAFTIDLNAPAPVVQPTNSMAFSRKFHNGVMLPNGEVLVVGGNTSGAKFSDNGAVLATEIWSPQTGQWRRGASMATPRNYHSIALLLIDGRVLAAGGGYCSGNAVCGGSSHKDAEIYSPAYLFDASGNLAARPQIGSGPGRVSSGENFTVSASPGISRFSMIKMSSTTHGVNSDVRFLDVGFSESSPGEYTLSANANPNVLTAGYWMLFALNASGVPSVAHVLQANTSGMPWINKIADKDSQTGEFASVQVVAGDADNDTLTYSATGLPDGLSIGPTSGQISGIPSNAGSYVVTVNVTDNDEGSRERAFDWNVFAAGQGQIKRDWWTGIGGNSVSILTGNAAYPNSPTGSDTISSFETPTNFAENYGTRVHGYLTPDVTGDYRFWIATDDGGELWLSTDSDPANKTRIAHVPGWAAPRQWTKFAEQQSVLIPLIAGQTYFIEALQKEGGGGDNLAVGWRKPGDTGIAVIPGAYLSTNPLLPQGPGQIRRDWWTGISGNFIADLRSSTAFPDSPAGSANITSFETPTNFAENYGTRVHGYLNPDVTGDYRFWIATDDYGELWLSPDSNPANKIRIAHVPGWAASRQWNKFAEQQSALVPLVAGQSYFIEALQKEGGGGDNLAVGWRKPGGAGIAVIPGANLSTNAVPVDQPLSVVVADSPPETTGSAVTYDATGGGGTGLLYNWNFGDGSPETGFSIQSAAQHSYAAPGRYIVSVTVRDPQSGEEVGQTFVQLVHRPLASFEPASSSSIVFHESARQVWNVNPDNDTVTAIDTISSTRLAEIPVGANPVAVQIAPNGNLWVVNKGSASISIIDTGLLAIVSTINLARASQPHGLVFNADLAAAYVVLEGTGELLKLNAGSGAEVSRTYVGNRPRHISIGGNGQQIFVSRFVTPTLPDEWTDSPIVEAGGVFFGGEVIAVNAGTMAQTGVATLRHSDRAVSEHTGPGVPNYLGPAVMSPDASAAWVPSKQDNVLAGGLRGGQGMTFDQTVRAVTSKIDLPGATEAFWARIDHDNASVASHAAFGPYGAYLFTALEGNREIAVSDAYTATELLRFDTGRAPQGLAVAADGRTLYVHNFMDRTVAVYDISPITAHNELSVNAVATIDAVQNEKLSSTVLTGKQLFYDARDPRLALDSYMSCASCHNQGGEDGRIWDFTGVGEGLRNTITLEGRAATVHGFLHWSANFDEAQDFEGQIRNFAGGTGLMADGDFFAGTRSQPLGDPKTGISADLDALAAYLASLDSFADSPYRNTDGTFSAEGESGRLVFDAKGCGDCHTPARYTDSSVGNLHDIGTLKPSSGNRLGSALTGIDTPSLISIWNTAPYLHDGSALDATEAISAHAGLSITSTELTQLGMYLQELDGVTAGGNGNAVCTDCIDFDDVAVQSYSNQDRVGTYSIGESGLAIELQNNTWKRTVQNFAIAADTILEFDFESSSQGEIHGIGFDEDNSLSSSRIFRVYGTQNWGIGSFANYSGSGRVTIQIPIGQYYTGSAMGLVLVNDHDGGSGNNSVFSNIRIVTGQNVAPVIQDPGAQMSAIGASVNQDIGASDANNDSLLFSATGLPTGLGISSSGRISGTPTAVGDFPVTVTVNDGHGESDSVSFNWQVVQAPSCDGCINFNQTALQSFSNQDAVGTNTVVELGFGIALENNTWKRTTQTFTISANTVVEFEFESTAQGEIHGIGFDEDNSLTSSRIFRVYGTQNWGVAGVATYGGTGRVTMQIPVGQYYTGSSMHLVLVNDFDNGSGNNSTFSNIRVFDTP